MANVATYTTNGAAKTSTDRTGTDMMGVSLVSVRSASRVCLVNALPPHGADLVDLTISLQLSLLFDSV